jgi:hypothetical protein
MDLLERGLRFSRRCAALTTLGLLSACGGDGTVDPPPPPPAVTADFSATITPSAVKVGDVYSLEGVLSNIKPSPGAKADSVAVYDAAGKWIQTTPGGNLILQQQTNIPGQKTYTVKGFASRSDGSGAIVKEANVNIMVQDLPLPIAQLTIHTSKDSVIAGTPTTLGAKLKVTDGKADSIVVSGPSFRFKANGDSLSTPYTPTQSGKVTFEGYFSRTDGSAAAKASQEKNITKLYQLQLQFKEFFGDTALTSQSNIKFNGKTYTTDANGKTTILHEGPLKYELAQNNATYPGDLITFNNGIERANYQRFKTGQNATAGEDTITINSNANATIHRVTKTDATFNDNTINSWYRHFDLTDGTKIPAKNTTIYIATKAIGSFCQDMTPAEITAFEQQRAATRAEFGQYYNITDVTSDIPPLNQQGIVKDDHLLSCKKLGQLSGGIDYYPGTRLTRAGTATAPAQAPVGVRGEMFTYFAGSRAEGTESPGISSFEADGRYGGFLQPFDRKAIAIMQRFTRISQDRLNTLFVQNGGTFVVPTFSYRQ